MGSKKEKPEQLNNWERAALGIYNSDDVSGLIDGMVRIDLIIEAERSKAAHRLAFLVGQKLRMDGYIVVSDIDEALGTFHADELLGGEYGAQEQAQ